MPYFQSRFLNPREPRYDWLDAMPSGGCAVEQPFQIPPLPTVWPEETDLWGAAWPNGLPEAGATSFDGKVPPVVSRDWTTSRGVGGLLPFAEVGGWFDAVKIGVLLVGGLMGGYLVGYLYRELRTPRATNRRRRRRNRRRSR